MRFDQRRSRLRFFFLKLGCLLLVLTGCSSSPRQKTLTVTMSLGEEEWAVFRQELFPRFKEHTGITIKAYQIEAGHLPAKLEALRQAGRSEIDVFAQDNMNLAALINKDLVLDLSAYQEQIPSEVFPNLVSAGMFGERLMFMPFRPNVQIAYYNIAAFQRARLSPPRTWDDLLAVGQAFVRQSGVGRILLKGYGGNPTATQVYEFVLQAGGEPYAFNDAGCVRAFQFLQKLRPYLSPETNRAKWDTVNEIMARQEAYLSMNWPFGVVILVKDYGLDYIGTYAGWQGPVNAAHVIGGDVFGIPKHAQHVDEALTFIRFMQSKEVQEILVTRLGWPSIRSDAYGQVQEWQKPHFESVSRALQHGVFRRNVSWWPLYAKYASQAFQKIVLGGEPVAPTLNRLKQRMEEEKRTSGL